MTIVEAKFQSIENLEVETNSLTRQVGSEYLETWIIEDLKKSGLTTKDIRLEPLKREAELKERLGFTVIAETSIMSVGGYWIRYPNVPNYYRLKLKVPIKDKNGKGAKYLSGKGKGNKPFILPIVNKVLENGFSRESVFVTEGEKKATKATVDGFPCIGLSGVWSFRDKNSDFLPELNVCEWKGRRVYVVFDSDVAENTKVRDAETRLTKELINRGAEVFIIRLPGEPNGEKNGLDDFLIRHGSGNFKRLVEKAKPIIQFYKEAQATPPVSVEVKYPHPLDGAAYYGLAGEIVRAIEPHSEADPAALLLSLIVGFGNVIGGGSHFMVGKEKHFFKLFAALVGESSKARKGTSWSPIRGLFEAVDSSWVEERIKAGLTSGEGLIYHVRDPEYKGDKVVDEGVIDKRLFMMEGELAQALKVLRREGNTLSPTLRNAWDSGSLQTLSKNSPIKASGTHISILGHITKSELVQALNVIETGNGFANRFLWFCVRRSKVLPFGGDFESIDFESLTDKLCETVDFAKTAGQITWGAATKSLWASVYGDLSEGKPGLIGTITARAEAQVTRLACIYALLDKSKEIEPPHLKAALALWSYTETSVRYIFQNSAGDPLANKILKILSGHPEGIGRGGIYNLLSKAYKSDRISEALDTLKASGFANNEKVDTAGRPIELWFPVENNGTKDS